MPDNRSRSRSKSDGNKPVQAHISEDAKPQNDPPSNITAIFIRQAGAEFGGGDIFDIAEDGKVIARVRFLNEELRKPLISGKLTDRQEEQAITAIDNMLAVRHGVAPVYQT